MRNTVEIYSQTGARVRTVSDAESAALYGQFQHLDSVDIVLNGLLKIGFHKVYEVAKAAEMISDFERQSISRCTGICCEETAV